MFSIVSKLKSYGHTEDGEEFVGEAYMIWAEKANGERLCHFHLFDGVNVELTEEGIPMFIDVRESAKAAAERLLARIEAENPDFETCADSKYWGWIPARYGSVAFEWENF